MGYIRTIIVLITFAISFLITHNIAQAQNGPDVTLLNYTTAKFSLQYPNDWNFTQKDDGMILFTPVLDFSTEKMGDTARLAFFGPKFSISQIKPMFPDMTSNEICNSLSSFLENAGYIIYHQGEKSLPNISDQACTVQYAKEGEENKAMEGERNNQPGLQVIVKHEGIAYFLEYTATTDSYFSKYMPVMEQLTDSFTFPKNETFLRLSDD